MNYYITSSLVNFILSSFLGVIVFVKNPKNKTNLTFSLFAFSVAFWSLAYFFWQISTFETSALFWLKILMAFAIFIPAFYLHFVFSLIRHYSKTILVFTYTIFFIFLLVDLFTSYFVAGVKPILSFKFWPMPGIIFHLFLLIWAAYIVYSTYLLYALHQKSIGLVKMQTKYLLLGMAIGFTGGSTNYFLWYGIPVLPFGNILVSIYVATTAYAIIRHRFLDIRLVIARTVAYSLLLVIISVFYVSATFVFSSFLLGSAVVFNQTLVYTGLTVFVALSFNRLKIFLEKLTDKIFFKGSYNSDRLLSKLSTIMSTNIELGTLCNEVLDTLIRQMRISKGAFVILGEGLASVYDIVDIGFSSNLTLSYNQVSAFFPFAETIVFDELEENHLKNLMRELDISIAKTLMVKNQVIGLLILGEKSSGDVYPEQDLKVLEISAPEVAVAVQNSLSYDKIKKFNVILTEEVKKATSDLQIANTKLKELDQLKDDFVSVASHELRTPMTAIRSYAWMALHRSDIPLSQKLERYLYRTLISTERLINLVNDMLNVSRIESGNVEIDPKSFNIMELVTDVIEEVKVKADEKKLHLSALQHPLPPVFADPDKVHQILLNLIGNAIKFDYPGGNIVIDFFTDGKIVEISIKDTGSGISRENLSKLFHKFSRLDNSYSSIASSAGGTGLGLYISKSLVGMMHGNIRVESAGEEKGSTFTFSLPVATQANLQNISQFQIKAKGEAKGLEQVAI